MNTIVYNGSILTGTALIGVGAAMINIPAALIITGALIIGLALMGAYLSRKV